MRKEIEQYLVSSVFEEYNRITKITFKKGRKKVVEK